MNPNTVRDKWRELCGGEKVKGKFSQAEDSRAKPGLEPRKPSGNP